jgi:hypothetical protein
LYFLMSSCCYLDPGLWCHPFYFFFGSYSFLRKTS